MLLQVRAIIHLTFQLKEASQGDRICDAIFHFGSLDECSTAFSQAASQCSSQVAPPKSLKPKTKCGLSPHVDQMQITFSSMKTISEPEEFFFLTSQYHDMAVLLRLAQGPEAYKPISIYSTPSYHCILNHYLWGAGPMS